MDRLFHFSKPFFVFALVIFSFGACSNAYLQGHARDASFYQRYVNSYQDFPKAAEKMSTIKILESGEVYPMRVALFDNERVFYQVDKLGDGTGWWKMDNGTVKIIAQRPRFDMIMYISAAEATGDQSIIKFVDRHGLNTLNLNLRDPIEAKTKGLKLNSLRVFETSDRNI